MEKPKSINDLLRSGGKRLSSLSDRLTARDITLKQVCAALPVELATAVVSAGVQDGKLTIGVAGAAWAARLRYSAETLRTQLKTSAGIQINSVRIKVLPSRA